MHTQPPPSYLHTSKKPNPLYTKTPLPPVPLNSIHLLWNNTNALQIENETTLAKSINNYLKHEPTILGLIETKRNFQLYDQMTKPLQNMVQACLRTPAKIKLVTGSYPEEHTARKLKEPSGVCQLMLGKILSLHQQSGRDNLGRWVWQQIRINGTSSLYVITAYRVCPKPPNTSKMKTAWHQQYHSLIKKGIKKPDPRQRFMINLRKLLSQLRDDGSEYILGWDANTPHNHDDIQDFLQDHDMVDAFSNFMDARPAMDSSGSE
jgi:exonuclease III